MELFGLAIFASVVLYLAVTHTEFRRIVLWAGALLLLCAIAGSLYLWHRNRVREAAQAVKSIDFPITSLEFSPEQTTKDTQTEQNGALAAYNNAYADLVHQCVYGRIQDVRIVDTEWSDGPPDTLPADFFAKQQAAQTSSPGGGNALASSPVQPSTRHKKTGTQPSEGLPNFLPADPSSGGIMGVKLDAVCRIEPK